LSTLELWHNELSTCSQKVRLVLAEKRLDFTSRTIDLVAGDQHAPEYVKLNRDHVVPTLVHDGEVLVESSLINEYLEEAFPDVALAPEDPAERHAMRLWIREIDQKMHPATTLLTLAITAPLTPLMQPPGLREANLASIPDPAVRAARRSVLEHGVDAPEVETALGALVEFLDAMERALVPGRWLSGDRFGLADASALPYVLRLEVAVSPLLANSARRRVADWLARVKERPSFGLAVAAWVPAHVLDILRYLGEDAWAKVEPLTRRR